MARRLIFILGGARSGKSAFAERLAQPGAKVLFVATAQALDEDMERRIEVHRRSRPPEWRTLEEPFELALAIPPALEGHDICLLDCLTLWVSNLLLRMEDSPTAEEEILSEADRLLEVYSRTSATWIVVSNEVGLGVVPPYPLGTKFRDILGRVNQTFASCADEVYLMIAGMGLEIKSFATFPHTRGEFLGE